MPKKSKLHPLSFSVKELARLLECPYDGDGETRITGVAGLENAQQGDLVFLTHARFRSLLENTKASAAIIPSEDKFKRIPVLKSANPYLSFIKAVEFFYTPYRPEPGIHPTAVISPSAKIGNAVSIGAFCSVGDDVEIGARTVLFPLVTLYPRVKIGEDTVLHSLVSIREDTRIENRVLIHNGAVVGSDGFGFQRGPDGRLIKIPQKGTVIIEDDVEVGANTAIDRAALGETIIRRGTKIDNLVQVAHNVNIGENCILAGQTGIAGSTKIGKSVIMGGQVGLTDHITIGDSVIIAAKSGVSKSVPPHSFVAGSPHVDIHTFRKVRALMPQLYDLAKDLKRMKAKVEELERILKDKNPQA
ncbi:MAG: UDP-3-O-(3-hydroxymyristoyl)glucosamine N-acyltransferase [Candidatus Aminicenantales bacterium]